MHVLDECGDARVELNKGSLCSNGKKLVLFDFDGVLVRSNHCHLKNIRDTFRESGVALDANDAEIMRHFGKSYKVLISDLLDDAYRTPEVEHALGKRLREKFENERFWESFERIEGLSSYLFGLRKNGYELGIASGNGHAVLEMWTTKLGIRDFFGLLIGVDDVKRGKPYPDMVFLASEFFKVAVSDIVFVGDARSDVLMAKSAGALSAVVLSGVLSREEAEGLCVDMIAEDVTKLDL